MIEVRGGSIKCQEGTNIMKAGGGSEQHVRRSREANRRQRKKFGAGLRFY